MSKLLTSNPKCRMCRKNRDKVRGLIVCANASICSDCLEIFKKLHDQNSPGFAANGKCTFCNRQPGQLEQVVGKGKTARICLSCMALDQAIMQGASEDKRPFVPSMSSEQKKAFHAEGLELLRRGPLHETSAGLIAYLLSIKSTKEVLAFCRRWLKQFPNHEDAPMLVGSWMQANGSNEAIYFARHYLRTVPQSPSLRKIVESAVAYPQRFRRSLFSLIGAGMEREPSNIAWSYVQPFRTQNKHVDQLVIRWINQNQHTTSLGLVISQIALFNGSVEVAESVLRWVETHGRNDEAAGFAWLFLFDRAEERKQLIPRMVQNARSWVTDHPEDELCGMAHGALIRVSGAPEDIDAGMKWYKKHNSAKSSWHVLRALLVIAHRRNEKADPYVVQEAKRIQRGETKSGPIRSMMRALLVANPESDTIELGKQLLEPSAVLASLLKAAPSQALCDEGIQMLIDGARDYELLESLMQAEPKNKIVRDRARRWIRNHKTHPQTKALKSLLQSQRC